MNKELEEFFKIYCGNEKCQYKQDKFINFYLDSGKIHSINNQYFNYSCKFNGYCCSNSMYPKVETTSIDKKENQLAKRLKKYSALIKLKTLLEFLVSVSTVLSMILVYFTLIEMQTQRNNAYMPDIIIETSQLDISWGDQDVLDDINPFAQTPSNINPSSIPLKSLNIGVGAAKNIRYSVDIDTYISWINLLQEIDSENEYSYSINNNHFILNVNDSSMMFSPYFAVEKIFLLSNSQESFEFYIPFNYTKLIEKIYEKSDANPREIPDIKMSIAYNDIQGKQYKRDLLLAVEPIFLISDQKGNGMASYNVIQKQ